MQKDKESVRDMFNSIAPKYDFLNHLLSAGVDKGWRRRLVKLCDKQHPKRILDMATGTADLAIALAKKISTANIIGGDISVEMLEVGREKVENNSLSERITLQECDALSIPFEDNSFDVVTCAFGVRNFEDTERGMSDIYRVCKQGGKIFILEFSMPENKFVLSFYLFYFKHILPLIGRMVSKDNRAYSYLPESVSQFPYGKKFTSILEKVGFENCKIRPLTFGIATIYEATK